MQKLINSELRYRRLFEAAQDGILILDAETGMIEDVNPYLMKMLGYSREEFVKKKLWEVGAFKDIEASQDAFEALQKNEYIRYEDLPLKTKDGLLIQVEFVSNVYLVDDEKVIQCNIRDVTEHRRIVAALQANEKKYHDLINQSPDGYFIIELSGNILTVNKAMCKELEFSEEEFLAMTIWDIIPEPFLDQYRERLTKILKGESLKEAAEYEVRGKDGKNHYVEVLSAPRYSGRDIIGFQGIARDISARKRAEGALRESERRFRLASWATKDVIWERNLLTNTILWNESLRKIFHYSVDEIEPTVDWWQDHIHPAEQIKVINSIQAAIEQGEDFWSKEYRFRLFDGSYVDIFDRGYILYNEQGKPMQMIGAMIDITYRKQAEEALRLSEEKYRTLVNEVNDGFYVTDSAGIFTFANIALAQIYGVETPQALVGRMFSDFIAPEMPADIGEAYHGAMETGRSLEVINGQIVRPDGTRVFIEIKPVMMIEGGQVVGARGVVRDITERKQAEEALRESEERFRALIENSGDVISVLTGEGIILYESPAVRQVLGYQPSEMVGHNDFEYLHPDDYAASQELFGKLFQQPQIPVTSEVRYKRKDDTWAWVRATGTNLLADPSVKAIVINYHDITERKQAERKIRRQIDYLTALQDIDRTIASAFDMRPSLNVLISKVISLLEVDAAAVSLINLTMNSLEFAAGDGFRTNAIKTANVKLSESYAGRAAMEHRIVKIPNPKNEPDNLLLTDFFKGEDFVGYYGVPLIVEGKVMGVLEVFQRSLVKRDQEWIDFLNALAGQAAIAISSAQLFDNLQRSNSELIQAYDATIEGWSHALDLRDKETEGHTQRVTKMTVKLARAFGVSEEKLVQVRWGALLHDIGKMGVPDGILLKPGTLTDKEWVVMKKHPTFACEMLAPIHYLRQALDIPCHHHEKWDGSGYPHGLKGDQIPLTARIFAVVDVWDALTSDRPYRAAWTKEKAREHIRTSSGTHFDPQVVSVFMQMSD